MMETSSDGNGGGTRHEGDGGFMMRIFVWKKINFWVFLQKAN
jgi:hypothetical protein